LWLCFLSSGVVYTGVDPIFFAVVGEYSYISWVILS